MSKFTILGDRVRNLLEETQIALESIMPLVVICGRQKCDDRSCDECEPSEKCHCTYNLRYEIKNKLNEENCLAATFEEDFNLTIASIEERIILKKDVDLIFLIPDSPGSAAELALFAKDPIIRPKLRVLVPHQYHPLYSDSESFLTSFYWELMPDMGHIYPIDPTCKLHPSGLKIASKMMHAFRLNRLAILLNGK